ncbi:MAG: stage IV sporulation protein A [Clostridia bacterium]|nr:stage IV sporulation protein A [Clostridia bacterium]
MENIYKDIAQRTQGDIYIGVVGPVRTGKSTFIKRFMDTKVLPNIDNSYKRDRARDELPQSASGRTIMTTEPKFVPNEAVNIRINDADCNVRMVDCVGYMVRGALGSEEEGAVRMVQTPWDDAPMPFDEAAEIGTEKVIKDHSTIGIVVTTDGSITEIPRESYIEAEERVVGELKKINKPFAVLLNSVNPAGTQAKELRKNLEEKYGVPVICVSCAQLDEDDIESILTTVLYEFPLTEIGIDLPGWLDALEWSHPLKNGIFTSVRDCLTDVRKISDAKKKIEKLKTLEYADDVKTVKTDLGRGIIGVEITTPEPLFYEVLSSTTGLDIADDGQLLKLLIELKEIKKKYDKLEYALKEVDAKGYGVVYPSIDELRLEEPEIVRQGNRYGVRLKAAAPSLHLIRAEIETEVSPIVGTEKQSEELVRSLVDEFESEPQKIWESNIFGKSLHELVNDGLHTKLSRMPDESRFKIQETLQRIINEGSGGLICIIL